MRGFYLQLFAILLSIAGGVWTEALVWGEIKVVSWIEWASRLQAAVAE
jgi:hypothetical protein